MTDTKSQKDYNSSWSNMETLRIVTVSLMSKTRQKLGVKVSPDDKAPCFA